MVDISELGTEIDYELIENFCGNVGEEFGHSFEVIGNIYDNPELIEGTLIEGTLIEGTGNQEEGNSWEERQCDHDD